MNDKERGIAEAFGEAMGQQKLVINDLREELEALKKRNEIYREACKDALRTLTEAHTIQSDRSQSIRLLQEALNS